MGLADGVGGDHECFIIIIGCGVYLIKLNKVSGGVVKKSRAV